MDATQTADDVEARIDLVDGAFWGRESTVSTTSATICW